MNKIIRISAAALLLVAACQKTELPENNTTQENPATETVLSEEQALIKSMLAKRDTRWTEDDLDIPEVSGEWNLIANDKELAFFLEFGCAEGGKYRLENDLNLASSEIAEKFTSEIGIEKFVNFEFDGNDKTISGLNLPIAAGLFSEISGTSKVYDLTLDSFIVGSSENVSNLLGTGLLCGSAKGTLEVSNVTVSNSSVSAPCKVGGMIGSFVDGTASFDGCAVNSTTVQATYLKGISGWCGGFIGFVGRSEEKNAALSVAVETNDCSVNGCTVKARMESDTRFSGKFLGTIVGYDENEAFRMAGCSVSDDTTLSITDVNGAAYKSEDPSGLIGGHKYLGGLIYVDGAIYVIPWDGVTVTEPALEGDTYMVYTAAELAWFQGKTVTKKIRICSDINLGGKQFEPICSASYIDGAKEDGTNSQICNLKIVRTNCGKEDGGAFIRMTSKEGTTVHKNLTFRGADIRATHDTSADHGNAYCATLCGNMTGTYTMENVHAYNGKLYGVNKMGGLLGRVYATATISNCSVNGYYIENYTVMDKPETFSGTAQKMGMTVTAQATFYPHGEIGGMIGFIQGNTTVTDCYVKSTQINAVGQADQKAELSGDWAAVLGINALGGFTVPGRHVSTLIGDIRTGNSSSSFNITISRCSADAETESMMSSWDKHASNAKFIGQCYYVYSADKSEGSVTVDGSSLSINHCVSW